MSGKNCFHSSIFLSHFQVTFRLVNILHTSNKENVWKAISRARLEFFLESEGKSSYCNDFGNEHLLKLEHMDKSMKKLEKSMAIKSSWFHMTNVSYETFQSAAEMFLFLNYCPPKESFLFTYIFKNLSPKDIILALSNILKVADEDIKKVAAPVWLHFSKKYNLLYTDIERLHTRNQLVEENRSNLREALKTSQQWLTVVMPLAKTSERLERD